MARRPFPIVEQRAEHALSAWSLLLRRTMVVQRQVARELARHGMSLAQFDLLATLRFSEGVTQQELAGKLLVSKGNICGLLDRMQSERWVERRPDPTDARTNRLFLTVNGRRCIDHLLPVHDAVVSAVFSSLNDRELKELRDVLEKLRVSG